MGTATGVNRELEPPQLDGLLDLIFQAGGERLSRGEIRRRVRDLGLPVALTRLVDALPAGNYERYQMYAVLDQIRREGG